jgi:hypothetical protein
LINVCSHARIRQTKKLKITENGEEPKLLDVCIKCNIMRFVLHLAGSEVMVKFTSATEFPYYFNKNNATELWNWKGLIGS